MIQQFLDLHGLNIVISELRTLIASTSHTHSNKSILDKITEAFTTTEKEKLSNIEDGATNTSIEIVRWM